MNNSSKHIDAKGLICPMGLLLLKKAVTTMSSTEQISIEVTDVHAELDFEIWCERFGHDLELIREEAGVWYFLVTKA